MADNPVDEPLCRTSAGLVMREYFQTALLEFSELTDRISAGPYDTAARYLYRMAGRSVS